MKKIKTIVISTEDASSLCIQLTTDLPEYFGLPECNIQYAEGVKNCVNFAATIDNENVGLLSLDFPYPDNANIYWMAVSPDFHHQGVGTALVQAASEYCRKRNIKTLTVETLSPDESDENYLKTWNFYKKAGFLPLFNLKPQGYEWNMVYMLKQLESTCFVCPENIHLRNMNPADIPVIVSAFKKINWDKPAATFEKYLEEEFNGTRKVWIAESAGNFAGYITLKFNSLYEPFSKEKIPEIMDLNVLPQFRNQGIGSLLLDMAEKTAFEQGSVVGLGVGLYAGEDGGYGMAQRLYVKRGYIPDGNGLTWNYDKIAPGSQVVLDDDLVLWFTKRSDT